MTIKNIKIDLLEKQSKTNLPFKINKTDKITNHNIIKDTKIKNNKLKNPVKKPNTYVISKKVKSNITLGKQMSPKNCKPNIFLEKKSPKKSNPDIVLYKTNEKKVEPLNNKIKQQKKISNYYQIKKHYKFKQKEKLKNIKTNLLEKGIIQSNNCPDKLVKELNWLIDDNKIHITKINV